MVDQSEDRSQRKPIDIAIEEIQYDRLLNLMSSKIRMAAVQKGCTVEEVLADVNTRIFEHVKEGMVETLRKKIVTS